MKQINKRFLSIYFVAMIMVVLPACKKFVQLPPAPGLINTDLVFETEGTALSAVSGVYAQLRSTLNVFSNGGLSVYGGLAADELYATAPGTNTDPFFQNQLLPSNSVVNTQFYAHAYRTIYQSNAVVEGLGKSQSLPQDFKKGMIGEMKVIRSLMYFYLLNLFGDVPLITSTSYKENAVLPRTAKDPVYDNLVQDLTDARNSLPVNYPSTGKVRVNKHTATALLARVYLYRENWAKAEELASEIIGSAMYTMAPSQSIANVFLKNSTETIWEIASPGEGAAVGDAAAFVPSSSTVRPAYALTNHLLNSFETGDKRIQQGVWISRNTVNGQGYTYPFKYKQRTIASGATPTEYGIVFRLAEIYLIRAEARLKRSNLDGAREDLNIIRNRAGLPNTTASDATALLSAIEKENQTEFFAEWGHRWLDLKRWRKADAVLGPIKGTTWQSTDVLWPIPESEINNNPFLSQNPGY